MAPPEQTITLPARRWRIDPRKTGAVAALCWAGFALIVWLTTTGRSAALDSAGLLFWRHSDLTPRGPGFLLEAARDVTALGGVLLRNLIALGAVAALLFLRLRREAILLGSIVMLGWLLGWSLKMLIGRARPEIVPHLMHAGGASFPSGHSFNSAVVYIGIALAFAAMSQRASVRLTLITAAIVLSLAVAWSRVWLGVHFPTDVVAGWLGGAGWAFLAAALLQPSARRVAEAVKPVGTPPAEARR